MGFSEEAAHDLHAFKIALRSEMTAERAADIVAKVKRTAEKIATGTDEVRSKDVMRAIRTQKESARVRSPNVKVPPPSHARAKPSNKTTGCNCG